MLFQCRSARTGWVKDLAAYWRELLFWMLLLPAFGALGSIRLRGQIVGLIETCAFLLVAISSTGKLKSLGLEVRELESNRQQSRRGVRRSRSPCGRLHCGGREPFAATPRNRERMEQGNVGNCTRAGSGRGDLQRLSIYGRSSAYPAPVPVGIGYLFDRRGGLNLLDSASHDCRDNGAPALLYCAYGLSVWLGPIPISIDRGSGSRPRSVQPGTLPQLLERPFALTRSFEDL